MNHRNPNPAYFDALAKARGVQLPQARTWSILLTSANHGTVGPVGSTFSHAGEHHERVQVMEIVEAGAAPAPGVDLAGLVRIAIDGTVIPLAAPSAPVGASTALTDERIDNLWHEACLKHLDLDDSAIPDFARAIERETLIAALIANDKKIDPVAAQAGQVAVPEGFALVHEDATNEMIAAIEREVESQLDASGIARSDMCRLDGEHIFDVLFDAMLAAAPAAPAQAKPLPAEPRAPTDLSQHMRAAATADVGLPMAKLLIGGAEEIERYYGGMMAWKQTAEKKDRDWQAERMARVNERCEARAQASTPGESQKGGAA